MQTRFSDEAKHLPRAEEAERILRSCVHCGFCNATCPTYQLLGDELDGPRGRIYLMKALPALTPDPRRPALTPHPPTPSPASRRGGAGRFS